MAIQKYLIYNNSTGRVLKQLQVDTAIDSTTIPLNTLSGETAYLASSIDSADTVYFPSGVRTDRPLFSSVASWNQTVQTADGASLISFGSSLPNPTIVDITTPSSVNNATGNSVTSGSVSISATVPAVHTVNISSWPYLDYTNTITFVSGIVTNISTPAAHLVITMRVPTIAKTSNNFALVSNTSHLTITPHNPTIVNNNNVQVSNVNHLTITSYAPSIVKTDNLQISVPTVHLTITTRVPTINSTNNTFAALGNTAHLVITPYTPIIN